MKKLIFLLLPLILLSAVSAYAQLETYMTRGKDAYRKHRYQQAITYFDRVIKENPAYTEVYVYRGLAYFDSEDYLGAEVDFMRALDLAYYAEKTGRFKDGKPYPRLSERDAAKLHNNRGLALYRLEEYDEAMDEFRTALRLDGSLKIAKENYEKARRLRRDPDAAARDRGGRYTGIYRDLRPQLPSTVVRNNRPAVSREEASRRRGVRLVEQGLRDPSRGLRPEKFSRRRIWIGSKVFKNVEWSAASQSYISIERIEINQSSTLVTMRVTNPTIRSADVCIADRAREGSFYLTDYSGSRASKIRFKGLLGENMTECPDLSKIGSGKALVFVMEFEKVPDDIGYVNLIEGSRMDGNQWNFYKIDLTE